MNSKPTIEERPIIQSYLLNCHLPWMDKNESKRMNTDVLLSNHTAYYYNTMGNT